MGLLSGADVFADELSRLSGGGGAEDAGARDLANAQRILVGAEGRYEFDDGIEPGLAAAAGGGEAEHRGLELRGDFHDVEGGRVACRSRALDGAEGGKPDATGAIEVNRRQREPGGSGTSAADRRRVGGRAALSQRAAWVADQ